MSDLTKHKDHFLLFVEAGFIAVNQSDEDSALKLFKAARMLNHENPLPTLGKGYLHLCKLELKQAITEFEAVLHKDPKNEMAKAMLGIALSMTPNKQQNTQGEQLLKETSKSKSKDVKNVCEASLDFVEKFVKKPVSPHELQAKQKRK
ncbi:MAG: SctF chaperone SctG [Chlamydiales bacterium]|nr:SctF chaperone SctG [Chlamydiales bacterium]